MSNLFTGLLSLLISTNQPQTATNVVIPQTNAPTLEIASPNDPVEKEFQELLADDDKAREEIDKWIRDSQGFQEQGAGSSAATLNGRIDEKLKPIKKAYENFLEKNPKHARARIAYGSFLDETRDEEGAIAQWEKARELDPKNPAVWNNLANAYGHRSPVKKSFEYYAKAIELNPRESVYYENFATTVYLFRKDAMEFYNISEAEVFDKSLALYRKAIELDPNNFLLRSSYAQSFYGTKPQRFEEGLTAWKEAFKIARDEVEQQGVLIHLARCAMNAQHFDEASNFLDGITNKMYLDLKTRLTKRLGVLKNRENSTNSPAADENP